MGSCGIPHDTPTPKPNQQEPYGRQIIDHRNIHGEDYFWVKWTDKIGHFYSWQSKSSISHSLDDESKVMNNWKLKLTKKNKSAPALIPVHMTSNETDTTLQEKCPTPQKLAELQRDTSPPPLLVFMPSNVATTSAIPKRIHKKKPVFVRQHRTDNRKCSVFISPKEKKRCAAYLRSISKSSKVLLTATGSTVSNKPAKQTVGTSTTAKQTVSTSTTTCPKRTVGTSTIESYCQSSM